MNRITKYYTDTMPQQNQFFMEPFIETLNYFWKIIH